MKREMDEVREEESGKEQVLRERARECESANGEKQRA